MKLPNTLNSDVLPLDVPPATSRFFSADTQTVKYSIALLVHEPNFTRCSASNMTFVVVSVDKIVDYEAALHDFARANNQDALDAINESGDYNDEIEAQLKSICDGFAEKGAY